MWNADRLDCDRSGRVDSRDAPDPARAVIAEDIPSLQRRDCRSAIDITADDRAITAPVSVVDPRPSELARGTQLRWDSAVMACRARLIDAPAEVQQRIASADHVDLLKTGETDIADPDIAIRPIDREPPRVAKTHSQRVPAGRRGVDVYRQELRVRDLRVLAVPIGVAF